MYKTNVNLKSQTPPFCYYKGITGSKPSLIISYKNGEINLQHFEQSVTLQTNAHGALEFLNDLIENLEKPKSLNGKFYGLMGFFSFEFGLKLLDIEVHQENPNCPDFYFILPTEYTSDKTYSIDSEKPLFETPEHLLLEKFPEKLKSNLTENQYNKKLEEIRKLLTDGETYQVNFAQEFRVNSSKLPIDIFNKLHEENPSNQNGFLQTGNFSIISNSPECLYKKEGNKISTFPIKGTAPISENPQALLDNPKEQAELEMIVDLERNDLGRIAKPGTVKVSKHRYIETYKNLHHTVSQIDAELTDKTTFAKIIETMFPGGSITGCPKKRTSEIIHSFEPSPRGIYCGSLGIIDVDGDSEFNIMIRTIWMQQNNASFHSGGGITIQSINENEYQETLLKTKNLESVLKE